MLLMHWTDNYANKFKLVISQRICTSGWVWFWRNVFPIAAMQCYSALIVASPSALRSTQLAYPAKIQQANARFKPFVPNYSQYV